MSIDSWFALAAIALFFGNQLYKALRHGVREVARRLPAAQAAAPAAGPVQEPTAGAAEAQGSTRWAVLAVVAGVALAVALLYGTNWSLRDDAWHSLAGVGPAAGAVRYKWQYMGS